MAKTTIQDIMLTTAKSIFGSPVIRRQDFTPLPGHFSVNSTEIRHNYKMCK